MANSFLFREEVKNSVPTFHEKNKQEWVGLNCLRPLLNLKIMEKIQFKNSPKFWQKQAKTFVNLIVTDSMLGFRFGQFVLTKRLGAAIHLKKKTRIGRSYD